MRGVLLDGFACATWKTEKTEQSCGKLTLKIEPFEPLSKNDCNALAEEGERLLRFVAKSQGADEFEIRFGGEGT
jgi:hypothetical protein